MDGTIFDIKRFSVNDGPGIRTTVFLKGCPLSCWWCHNPESQSAECSVREKVVQLDGKRFCRSEAVGYKISVEKLFAEIRKELVFMDESAGGVTFSGGEPLMQSQFLVEILHRCKLAGIHTAVDTSGFAARAAFQAVAPFTDLFLFDVKMLDRDKHLETTGALPDLIFQNLDYLFSVGKKVRIRFPVIPQINDDELHLQKMVDFLKEHQKNIDGVDLLPFHSIAAHKYENLKMDNRMKGVPSMPKETLMPLKRKLLELGFNVSIGG